MPECSARYPAQVLVGEMCSTNEVDQCGDHMTCTQVMAGREERGESTVKMLQESEDSQMGKCECLSSFRQQADRTCVENVPLATPQPRVQEASGGAQAVVAVICILVLVVVSVLGVVLVR